MGRVMPPFVRYAPVRYRPSWPYKVAAVVVVTGLVVAACHA